MKDESKVEKPVEEATPQTEATPVEEKPEETPEPEAPPAEESAAEGEDGKSEAPKKSAEGRIRELASKVKEEKAKAQSLADQLKALTSQVGSQAVNPPYAPQVEAGQEVSPDEYKTDVLRTADSLVNLRLQQERVINRINQEAVEVMQIHPELNPDHADFNKELSDSVTEAALAYAQSNPTGSLKAFVDKLMKPYKKAVTSEVVKQTENLAKQVSEGALRPTNVKQGEKRFEELSIEEMEKKLGVVY